MLIVRAPLRISFAGGGTDLEPYYARYGGFVVSTAINRYCYVVASKPADRSVRISSADYHTWVAYPAGAPIDWDEPLSLPKAATAWFADHGLNDSGVDLFLASEVPPGTGLGGSSAMAVALGRALASYLESEMDDTELAELAAWMEIERLHKPIGKQDHYASAFGGLNSIEFASTGVTITPLDISAEWQQELCSRLLLFWTGQTRNSSAILRQQRSDSATNEEVIKSLHGLKLIAHEMSAALTAGDFDAFGHLMHLAWSEKKRLSNRVSSPIIDRWYDAAREAGALGGKLTGAGGGGFIVLYAPPARVEAVRARMTDLGLRQLTFEIDHQGAHVVTDLPVEPLRPGVPIYIDEAGLRDVFRSGRLRRTAPGLPRPGILRGVERNA
jgi:D-glycero-alpha-D-manno-heptose-7-phosphate kinase